MPVAKGTGSGREQNRRILAHRWLRAYGLFTGGVIGVGVFGLPAALIAAGAPLFLLQLVGVAFLVWWIHRCYVSVVLATPGRHRLPGYARKYLGQWGFLLTSVASVLGLIGALVAYLIAGGIYLRLFLEPLVTLPPFVATSVYLLPGALLLLWGLRALPAIELLILVLFLVVLLALPVVAGGYADLFRLTVSAQDLPSMLLPYGVLLFAFWGVSLIPETTELAGRSERRTRSVLTAGLVTAVLSYLLFAVLIGSVTGPATTEDALTGLRAVLGDGVVLLTLLFGLLTTFSSYLALGLTLLRTLVIDFRVRRLVAWAATVAIPVGLVALGARSLLAALSLTGAVFLGVEGLAVMAMCWALPKARRGPATRALHLALVGSSVLLFCGVIGEIARHVLT